MPDATSTAALAPLAHGDAAHRVRVSDGLQGWLGGGGEKTIGGLVGVFDKRAVALTSRRTERRRAPTAALNALIELFSR